MQSVSPHRSAIVAGCVTGGVLAAGMFGAAASCGRLPGAGGPVAPTRMAASMPTAERGPVPRSRAFRGNGDAVLRIAAFAKLRLVVLRHTGRAGFAVTGVGAAGRDEPLVDAVGGYRGTVLLGGGSVALRVRAEGPWRIRLAHPSTARAWKGRKIKGRGDAVLRLPAPRALAAVRATHRGRSPFTVRARTNSEPVLLVHHSGTYRGGFPLPASATLITIDADGPWSLTRI